MTTILIVLALAVLFTLFGLLTRGRQSACDGTCCGDAQGRPGGCSGSADPAGCPLALLGSRPGAEAGPGSGPRAGRSARALPLADRSSSDASAEPL